MELGAPIVPAWIEGTRDIVAPGTFDVRPGGQVTVRFGAPIPTAGKTKDDLPSLLEEVREAILSLSGKPRAEVDGGDAVQGSDPRAQEASRAGGRPSTTAAA